MTSLAALVAEGTPIAAAVGSLFGVNALQGLALKQDKIHTFNDPLDYDDSDPENRSLSLKYDMSLALDASGNLKVNSITWDTISDTPATFTPSAHTHAISEITNLQTTLDGVCKYSLPTPWAVSFPTVLVGLARTALFLS